jgi:hypothetical protein
MTAAMSTARPTVLVVAVIVVIVVIVVVLVLVLDPRQHERAGRR